MRKAPSAGRLRTGEHRFSGADTDPDLYALELASTQHADALFTDRGPRPGSVVLAEKPEPGAIGGRCEGGRKECLLAVLRQWGGGFATGLESHIHFGEQRTKLTYRNRKIPGVPRAHPVKEHRAGTPSWWEYSVKKKMGATPRGGAPFFGRWIENPARRRQRKAMNRRKVPSV